MTTSRPSTRGFTLIELLLVIAIVSLLVSLLLPGLRGARENARVVQCSAHLKQLATAAITHSSDRRGYFSTGPFDNRRTRSWGALDERGWIADYVNGGYAVVGNAMCPSSPARGSNRFAIQRLTGGSGGVYKSYSQDQVDQMIRAGYNTNYVQSWYMAYTGMTYDTPRGSGNLQDEVEDIGPLSRTNLQTLTAPNVVGPLHERHVGLFAPADKIPFFGDGSVENAPDDLYRFEGQQLPGSKTLSNGPSNLASGVREGNGRNVWGRQDYSWFGPTHGAATYAPTQMLTGTRTLGNIAFADGHVDTFSDTRGRGPSSPRDGKFDFSEQTAVGTIRTFRYGELEGSIYGGWLHKRGLNF
jgi:prepilin-type N-terminal cleavage/methylation domain-containing protein/prepilin-type processing-associated H-X9-DG protein